MSEKIEFNKKEFKDNHFATNFNFSDVLPIDNSKKSNLRILQKDISLEDKDTSGQLDVTIKKNPTSICIFADLCGIDKQSIDISLIGNQLTISAYRTLLKEDPEKSNFIVEELQLNEIQTGHIKKTISLDDTIDRSNIKTSLNNGLLSLELPIAKKNVLNIQID